MVATSSEAVKVFSDSTYLVEFKVKCPPNTLTIPSEKLRDKELVEAIKDAGGKSKDTIPMFEILDHSSGEVVFSLQKAATRLRTIVDLLQSRFMVSQGDGKTSWYVPASKIDALHNAIASELDPEKNNLLKEIEDNYDEAQSNFESRLLDVLQVAQAPELYQELANKFPSLPELMAKFGYEIIRWDLIPSLEEIQEKAKKNPSMQRTVEVVANQIASLERKSDDLAVEAYQLICDSLNLCDRARKIGSDFSSDTSKVLENKTERITTLLGIVKDTQLSEIWEHCDRAITQVHICSDRSEYDSHLFELRAILRDYTLPDFLEEWVYPDKKLEAEIEQLKAEIEAAEDSTQKPLLEKRLKAAEKKYEELRDKLDDAIAYAQAE